MVGNPSERRRTPRANADFPMRLGSLPAQLKDISEGGLACRLGQPMEEMTRVQIDLDLPAGDRNARHTVEGAIVYCAPSTDGEYDLGILFLAPPEDTTSAIRAFVQKRLSVEHG